MKSQPWRIEKGTGGGWEVYDGRRLVAIVPGTFKEAAAISYAVPCKESLISLSKHLSLAAHEGSCGLSQSFDSLLRKECTCGLRSIQEYVLTLVEAAENPPVGPSGGLGP
jgi:hypothetical protein